MGANIDAAKEADSIGISSDSAFNFEASRAGVEDMYTVINEKLSERRKG